MLYHKKVQIIFTSDYKLYLSPRDLLYEEKVECMALNINRTRLLFYLINFIWMIKIARHKLMFIAAANDRLFIIPQISVFVRTSSCCRSERCWLLLDLALCN